VRPWSRGRRKEEGEWGGPDIHYTYANRARKRSGRSKDQSERKEGGKAPLGCELYATRWRQGGALEEETRGGFLHDKGNKGVRAAKRVCAYCGTGARGGANCRRRCADTVKVKLRLKVAGERCHFKSVCARAATACMLMRCSLRQSG
jgi:hypothetical protein